MGSFYRSKHELVFVWKSGTAAHTNISNWASMVAIGQTSGTTLGSTRCARDGWS